MSELRKAHSGKGDPRVAAWAAATRTSGLLLSVVSVMELEQGILSLARRDPRQAATIRHWLHDQVLPAFEGRILVVDLAVARCCAALHVPDRRQERDTLIAATALVHGLTIVTRNQADFEPTGAPVLDPWQ